MNPATTNRQRDAWEALARVGRRPLWTPAGGRTLARSSSTEARLMLRLLGLSALLVTAGPAAGDDWVSLFNGKDLAGWETSLPAPLGTGRDPKGVFSVVSVDGAPAIRISGDGLGGLTTLKEYENYHLELEFKWGEKRFPPRENEPRDSGLLYHGSRHYNPATGWPESVEFGILEGGETGDFWSVPGAHGERIVVDLEGEDIPKDRRRYPNQPIRYRPGGKKYVGTKLGLLNGDDNEKPRGRWNKLELICLGQTGVHMVNGTVNLVLTNIRRVAGGPGVRGRFAPDAKEESVTRGRLQLQSEGAEVYFRNIRLRPIKEVPAEVRRAMAEPPANTLTPEEKAAGWRLLFDGSSTKGWRGYRQKGVPAGWQARQGALARVKNAGDLITEGQFGDFELLFDWKVSHGGNSGVFYRATEATP